MTILVTTLNAHRNNLQASSLMEIALKKLGYYVTRDVNSDYNLAIVWNSIMDKENTAILNSILKITNRVLYMHVDNDIPIPKGVRVITQFNNTEYKYFPISALAIFHKYWDMPIIRQKKFEYFYGGTYKERRDYSRLNVDGLLLMGDDGRWDKFPSTRFPTCRELDTVYHLMSLAKYTFILPDQEHDGINIPTRLYECVFTRCDCIMPDGSIYKWQDIKRSVCKNTILKQLKDLIDEQARR